MQNIFDRITTAKELKGRDDFADGASWYVENIIPRGTLCYMIGTEKSYKSTTMLDMALAISSGDKFMNEQTHEAEVLYIQPENTSIVEHMRLKQANKESTDKLHMLMYQFQIDDNNHLNSLYMYIKEHNIKVVILDNLKDLLSTPEALNDMTTANAIIKKINKMKMDFQDVTFIITHHTSKARLEQSLSEKDFRVIPSMGLGSSAWSASYEVCMTLSPKKGKSGQYSYLSVYARNFVYNKPVAVGYVGDTFTYITSPEEKKAHREEVEENELIKALKEQGKVTEVND